MITDRNIVCSICSVQILVESDFNEMLKGSSISQVNNEVHYVKCLNVRSKASIKEKFSLKLSEIFKTLNYIHERSIVLNRPVH